MDIVDEFGVADYMKIDIEGNDRVCIGGLTSSAAPKYISIEMDHARGDQDIKRLFELGYRSFKVICQSDSWYQVTKQNILFYNKLANKHLIPRCWRKLRRVSSICLSGRRIGESGPWGEKTSGSWHSVDHAHSVWCFLHELDKRLGTRGLGASLPSPRSSPDCTWAAVPNPYTRIAYKIRKRSGRFLVIVP
jgi:hypothetical protein